MKKSWHSQWFQLAAEWQCGFKKTSSLRVLKTNSDDLPLTFPSLSGRASQDAATEVGFPFSGQTSKFSGALAGAVKQPYVEEASKKSWPTQDTSFAPSSHSRNSYTAISKMNGKSTHGSGPRMPILHLYQTPVVKCSSILLETGCLQKPATVA